MYIINIIVRNKTNEGGAVNILCANRITQFWVNIMYFIRQIFGNNIVLAGYIFIILIFSNRF